MLGRSQKQEVRSQAKQTVKLIASGLLTSNSKYTERFIKNDVLIRNP